MVLGLVVVLLLSKYVVMRGRCFYLLEEEFCVIVCVCFFGFVFLIKLIIRFDYRVRRVNKCLECLR